MTGLQGVIIPSSGQGRRRAKQLSPTHGVRTVLTRFLLHREALFLDEYELERFQSWRHISLVFFNLSMPASGRRTPSLDLHIIYRFCFDMISMPPPLGRQDPSQVSFLVFTRPPKSKRQVAVLPFVVSDKGNDGPRCSTWVMVIISPKARGMVEIEEIQR